LSTLVKQREKELLWIEFFDNFGTRGEKRYPTKRIHDNIF